MLLPGPEAAAGHLHRLVDARDMGRRCRRTLFVLPFGYLAAHQNTGDLSPATAGVVEGLFTLVTFVPSFLMIFL